MVNLLGLSMKQKKPIDKNTFLEINISIHIGPIIIRILSIQLMKSGQLYTNLNTNLIVMII